MPCGSPADRLAPVKQNERLRLGPHNERVDLEGFLRDGYVAIRGAFDPYAASACRQAIWSALRARGIRADDAASWPALAQIDHLTGEPFTATGATPALTAAYDQLIGPGRWPRQVDPGRAVVVRFPSEDRVNVGYHVEGSFSGPGGYWANVRSRDRGLLALFLFTDVGPGDAPTRLICGSHLYVLLCCPQWPRRAGVEGRALTRSVRTAITGPMLFGNDEARALSHIPRRAVSGPWPGR